jgi:hypothetical protein
VIVPGNGFSFLGESMTSVKTILCSLVLGAALGSAAFAQPSEESIPKGPFRTVHLLNLTPAEAAKYKAAVDDFNRVFVKEGCPACVYRLFKSQISSGGDYNHLMVSEWPGRDMYIKLHAAREYAEVAKKDPIIEDMSKREFYGRFVEIK